jgi:CelD/BcsL family acetyltransferase involved in cellulose biosynthesis
MSESLTADVDRRLIEDSEWDDLLAASRTPTVFLTSGWLTAWAEAKASAPVLAVRVREGERLIAAAAFEATRDGIRFAGRGASDYCDVIIAGNSSDETAASALRTLLLAASTASPGANHFDLRRLPCGSRALALLDQTDFFVTARRGVQAPWMCMSAAPEKLKKKSLVRHERGLEKRGALECTTWRHAADILPRLDAFFDLHVQRWHGTDSPSLFLEEQNRALYRRATENLSPLGVLRYTEIRLDQRLLAAHYGFSWLGCFTWYKPCFDPRLAKLSPGEVLIKRLIELAVAEQATRFDFTIGNEPFKHRFATHVPHVTHAHVTRSRLDAGLHTVRHRMRRVLDGVRKER